MTSFAAVEAAFAATAEADPRYSAQLAVHVGGHRVIDLAVGALQPDSLLPVYSSSKGATATVIALLVDRGQLDLDATVASYWPEFGQRGKARSRCASCCRTRPGCPAWTAGSRGRSCSTTTRWRARSRSSVPSGGRAQAFMYHAVTIGTLADELVRRIDGRPVAQVLRDDVTGPRGIDIWMGTPASEDGRVVEALPPTVRGAHRRPAARRWAAIRSAARCRCRPAIRSSSSARSTRALPAGRPAGGRHARERPRDWRRSTRALRHEVDGQPRLLSDDTISQMSQIQVAGRRARQRPVARFGVIFQAPVPAPLGTSAASARSATTGPAGRSRSTTRTTTSPSATRCSGYRCPEAWTSGRSSSPASSGRRLGEDPLVGHQVAVVEVEDRPQPHLERLA